MQPWQVLTLDKANISKVMKEAKDKLISSSRYKYQSSYVSTNPHNSAKPVIITKESLAAQKFNAADYEVGGKYYIDPDTIPF